MAGRAKASKKNKRITHVTHVATISDLGYLSDIVGFDAHVAILDMSGMFRNMKLGEG